MDWYLYIIDKNINVKCMIRFVWISLVCCGVANGVIYSLVAPPERYLYIGAVLLVCFILVGIHRHFTKDLLDEKRDYDEDYCSVFIVSAVTVLILALVALIVGVIAVAVGLITSGIGFVLASVRESTYA